jgi:hypothetical protein
MARLSVTTAWISIAAAFAVAGIGGALTGLSEWFVMAHIVGFIAAGLGLRMDWLKDRRIATLQRTVASQNRTIEVFNRR